MGCRLSYVLAGAMAAKALAITIRPETRTVISGMNAFAFNAYRQMPQQDNFVFSPYSLYTAMSMTYAGERASHQALADKLEKILRDLWGKSGKRS